MFREGTHQANEPEHDEVLLCNCIFCVLPALILLRTSLNPLLG